MPDSSFNDTDFPVAENERLLHGLVMQSRERLNYEGGIPPTTELVIAGTMCSGKGSVAKPLAAELRYNFFEGDLFHLKAVMELAKISNVPMTDEYRMTRWFEGLANALMFSAYQHDELVMTCSALRRDFRQRLVDLGSKVGLGDLWIVWLDVPQNELERRARIRQENTGHPYGPEMIQSQLEAAEIPSTDEPKVVVVDGTLSTEEIIRQILEKVPGLPQISV